MTTGTVRRLGKVVAAAALFGLCSNTVALADPIGWAQPGGPGSPVVLTYSYSNLFDGGFDTTLAPAELRHLTELALGVWARHAPLAFVEVEDSGPMPITVDHEYSPDGTADIRIGYSQSLDGDAAHAHVPYERDGYIATGLAGDIHFANDRLWGREIENALAMDFFSVLLHETGHALGLLHIFGIPAVMSGSALRLEPLPEHADLLPADIEALHRLYGSGAGSVRPLPTPEPASLALVLAALAAASPRILRARLCYRVPVSWPGWPHLMRVRVVGLRRFAGAISRSAIF